MNPQASLSRTYRWALVLDEQELRRMVDECQRALVQEDVLPENIAWRFELTFSDGLSLTTNSIDEVVAEENPRHRSIIGITIYADLDVPKRSANITCRIGTEKPKQTSITVTESNRNWVHVTFSKIEERLRRMKQWHPRAEAVWGMTAVVGFSLFAAMMIVASKRYPQQLLELAPDGRTVTTSLGTAVVISGIALVIVAIFTLPLLFPSLVFRIGDGIARHDKIKSIRSSLAWALLAACVLTPLVRIISSLIW